MHSGELARIAGVSTDTLRHYEKLGVLARPGRTPAGYRQYPAEAIGRVHLIRHALSVGFSLRELARILRVRDHGGAPCRQVRDLLAVKLEEVDQRMVELGALRKHLKSVLTNWDKRLLRTPQGARASLLESLPPLPTRTHLHRGFRK